MKRQCGISLTEVLLSLGIIAVILTLSVRYFNMTSESQKVLRAVQQIETLTKASYEWLNTKSQKNFSNTPSGTTISFDELADMNLVSDSDNDSKDPWGGDITLSPGDDPSTVKIMLEGVPMTACNNMVQKLKDTAKLQIDPCTGDEYWGDF